EKLLLYKFWISDYKDPASAQRYASLLWNRALNHYWRRRCRCGLFKDDIGRFMLAGCGQFGSLCHGLRFLRFFGEPLFFITAFLIFLFAFLTPSLSALL